MKKVRQMGLFFVFIIIGCANITFAADQDRTRLREHMDAPAGEMMHDQLREQKRIHDRDIYGWQMMTPEERDQYRETMNKLKTETEMERFRHQHREMMELRARGRNMESSEHPGYDMHQERHEYGNHPRPPDHPVRPYAPDHPDPPTPPNRPEKPERHGMDDRPERPDRGHGGRR